MKRPPVFADPKTDFVFQRIFGSEDHKTVLIGFLNDVLELDEAHPKLVRVGLRDVGRAAPRRPRAPC